MQDTIAAVLESNVDKLVQASSFFSLLSDESTDVSYLVVYVKLSDDFKQVSFFWKTSMSGMGRLKLLPLPLT